MTTNTVSSAMARSRKHIVQRRMKAQGVFMDGVVTADEMKHLKEDFNEAYYELYLLRQMLHKQKDTMHKMSDTQRAEIADQMEALKKTERLVFKSYCHSVEALKKAKTMREQNPLALAREKTLSSGKGESTKAAYRSGMAPRDALRRLRIRLSPEEMALLSGCVLHALDPRRGREDRRSVERNLLRVASLIHGGERRTDVLMAALREGRTR